MVTRLTRWSYMLAIVAPLGVLTGETSNQVELKNLEFRKRHDITWDVSWKVDVLNRGQRTVRVWLEFTFIDADGFAVAEDNGDITVAAGDSITYRETRPFTPAKYRAIQSIEAAAEIRSPSPMTS